MYRITWQLLGKFRVTVSEPVFFRVMKNSSAGFGDPRNTGPGVMVSVSGPC